MLLTNSLLTKIKKARLGNKLVFTGGVFDLFHKGHFLYLKNAKKLGKILVVHLDSDALVSERKGHLPIIEEKFRHQMISSLKFVDFTYVSDKPSDDPGILSLIGPDIFVRVYRQEKGWLYHKKRLNIFKKQFPQMSVKFVSPETGISTSNMISQLSPRLLTKANVKSEEILIRTAREYMSKGYSYSGYKMGAALLSATGKIYAGINISNSSPALSFCAERVAVVQMMLNNDTGITHLALVSNQKNIPYPCGLCLQVLSDLRVDVNKDIVIYLENIDGKTVTTSLKKLLTHPFVSIRKSRHS